MTKIMLFGYCVVLLLNLESILAKAVFKRYESIETEERQNEIASMKLYKRSPLNRTATDIVKLHDRPPGMLVLQEARDLDPNPWHLGVVPYYFDHSHYGYDDLVAERVRLSMNAIEEASCVRFMPILESSSDEPWIHITNPDGIRSCVHDVKHINMSEPRRIMVLGYDCLRRREILHTLLHALGLKDEVTHTQRDNFIRVNWDNIHPIYHTLFQLDGNDYPTETVEYDGTSIMQFHDRAFSRNGRVTISSVVPGLTINPSNELSPLDKMKLRLMFAHDCNKRKVENIVEQCKYALQPAPSDDDNNADDYVVGDDEARVDDIIGNRAVNTDGGQTSDDSDDNTGDNYAGSGDLDGGDYENSDKVEDINGDINQDDSFDNVSSEIDKKSRNYQKGGVDNDRDGNGQDLDENDDLSKSEINLRN